MHYLFAWRYFKAKKSTNAINIISWVSIMAIIIGTSVLILVLSVFNGFEDIVKSLYSSFYTDLKVSPASGKVMQVSPQQLAKLDSIKGVKNFARVIEEKALVQNMNSDNQSVVYLKGVDEEYRYVTGVADALISGEYDLGETDFPKLILGAGVEYNL
jgi:lipoprotein-releasing system permease protein